MPLFFTSFRFALAGRGRSALGNARLRRFAFHLPRMQWMFILSLIVVGLLYLVEMNLVTMRGYERARLETKRRELLETKTALTTEATALRTLPFVETKLEALSFVKAEKGTYLAAQSSTLVER